MKTGWKKMAVVLSLATLPCFAQYESPIAYLNYLQRHEAQISTDYWEYIEAINHGRSARKQEKRRGELLKTVDEARKATSLLKPFEQDKKLRDAFTDYYNVLFHVLKEDYEKIIDLEAIAEQSYDAMETYLLAQDRAEDKLDSVSERRSAAYRDFAYQHSIRLFDGSNALTRKLAQGGRVSRYYRPLYLIFFKANKQEYYLMKSIKDADISGIEQNRAALIAAEAEGMEKLDTIKGFENDMSVVVACRKVMDFYRLEAETKMPVISRFVLKRAEFEKAKKTFDGRGTSLSNAEVDGYNKLLAEMKNANRDYNATVLEVNRTRTATLEQWQETVSKFLSVHTPPR